MSPSEIIQHANNLLQQNKLQQAKKIILSLIQTAPEHHQAWQVLAQVHRQLKEQEQYKQAIKQYEMIAWFNQRLDKANQHLLNKELKPAENIAHELLKLVANEYRVLVLLSKIAFQANDLKTYLAITSHNININSTKSAAYDAHIEALFNTKQYLELISFYNRSTKLVTLLPQSQSLLAAAYVKMMDFKNASLNYQSLLNKNYYPAYCNLRLGNIEKIIGNNQSAIAYYCKTIKLAPHIGEAYWNLANLKTYTFTQLNIANLEQQITIDSNKLNKAQLHFALAKAYEQQSRYEDAFLQLRISNDLQKSLTPYITNDFNERCKKYLTKKVANTVHSSTEDEVQLIFIVSLPRSGSTLIEQILASHSHVDASYELSEINSIAVELENLQIKSNVPYKLNSLTEEHLATLAKRYLKFIEPFRNNKPYFIDKQPVNFQHIALIKTLFPNAKIIDVQRDKKATAWSLYKHSFSQGHSYSYDQEDLAHYMNEYYKLMTHWHSVYPDEIYTINYESLINNFTETVNDLFEHCNLVVEQACYEFYNNQRPVLTPSSEQVRKPIYKEALTDWKKYANHLTPLLNRLN